MNENLNEIEYSRDIIASVEKAANLLLLFQNGQIEELGIQEISKLLSVPKTTAHRIATTLLRSKLLAQNEESRKYRLGINTFILGNRYIDAHSLEKISRDHLEKIMRRLGESASVSVLNEDCSVIVDKMDGLHSVRAISQIGTRSPLHCSGSGKIFLAYMSEDCRKEMLTKLVPLERLTPFTITDPALLLENLRGVTERGYTYDDEEIHRGQICISAPIYNRDSEVCAAVTVSGPKERLLRKGIEYIGTQLMGFCMEMSMEMGYVPDTECTP